MVLFKNLKDVERFISSPSGQSQIIGNLSIQAILKQEAKRLEAYLHEEISNHMASYTPTIYQRTGSWQESIRVNEPISTVNGWSISITFDDNLANHPSVVSGGEMGYVPWLMEEGWKDKGFNTPHFDGFEGTHYIKNAVARYNATNPFNFKITVYHGGKAYI